MALQVVAKVVARRKINKTILKKLKQGAVSPLIGREVKESYKYAQETRTQKAEARARMYEAQDNLARMDRVLEAEAQRPLDKRQYSDSQLENLKKEREFLNREITEKFKPEFQSSLEEWDMATRESRELRDRYNRNWVKQLKSFSRMSPRAKLRRWMTGKVTGQMTLRELEKYEQELTTTKGDLERELEYDKIELEKYRESMEIIGESPDPAHTKNLEKIIGELEEDLNVVIEEREKVRERQIEIKNRWRYKSAQILRKIRRLSEPGPYLQKVLLDRIIRNIQSAEMEDIERYNRELDYLVRTFDQGPPPQDVSRWKRGLAGIAKAVRVSKGRGIWRIKSLNHLRAKVNNVDQRWQKNQKRSQYLINRKDFRTLENIEKELEMIENGMKYVEDTRKKELAIKKVLRNIQATAKVESDEEEIIPMSEALEVAQKIRVEMYEEKIEELTKLREDVESDPEVVDRESTLRSIDAAIHDQEINLAKAKGDFSKIQKMHRYFVGKDIDNVLEGLEEKRTLLSSRRNYLKGTVRKNALAWKELREEDEILVKTLYEVNKEAEGICKQEDYKVIQRYLSDLRRSRKSVDRMSEETLRLSAQIARVNQS